MYPTNGSNNQNIDLPITAICIVSDKSRCPPNYTPIVRANDTGTEPDLWKDSLFGKKINRFFCFTKDYPINETYNVVEDIKLLNERDTLPGFIPLERCLDTSEKSFQKKTVNIKVSHRFYTTTAVSDIVLLVKSRRPPTGYSFIGEINGHAMCIKFSQIPNSSSSSGVTSGVQARNPAAAATPPPIPPRPYSSASSDFPSDYVNVPRLPPTPPMFNGGSSGFPINNNPNMADLNFVSPRAQQAAAAQQTGHHHNQYHQHSQMGFNPLQGVPFEINPLYNASLQADIKSDLIDNDRLNRKIANFNEILAKTNYDFKLERTLIASSP